MYKIYHLALKKKVKRKRKEKRENLYSMGKSAPNSLKIETFPGSKTNLTYIIVFKKHQKKLLMKLLLIYFTLTIRTKVAQNIG